MDLDPATFPNPTSNTVYVRALNVERSVGCSTIKKFVGYNPKTCSFLFYRQAQTEFDVTIKYRTDAAPDQERYTKSLREIKSKTKFYAGKHYIQQSYVGWLEGTEASAQRLTSLQ